MKRKKVLAFQIQKGCLATNQQSLQPTIAKYEPADQKSKKKSKFVSVC